MTYVDNVTEAVSQPLSGLIGQLYDQPVSLSPTMDAWRSHYFIGAPAEKDAVIPKPDLRFDVGDDEADRIARSRGVDPHANTSWMRLAKSQLGSPYVWDDVNPVGAEGGPGAGYDCSGFVQWLAKRVTGKVYTHHAATMATEMKPVGLKQLQPGDAVFFNYGDGIQHVEVYIGNGKTIGSASGGVEIRNLDTAHFQQGGRIPGMSAARAIAAVRHPKVAAGPPPEMTNPFAVGDGYFSQILTSVFK